MTSFPLLAQPLTVGAVTLANRMVMGSMHTNLEGNPGHFDQLGRFYAARAAGGAGLIVTGGFSPNAAGRLKDHPCVMASAADAAHHRRITGPVRAAGGRILLQILHAGRYGYHGEIVAPSPIKSPINRDTPAEMTAAMIAETIADFARAAELALDAGYDGVEIMGSEGYLMSQFLAARTNHRDDDWGGDFTRRLRFPVAVTEAVRAAMGTAGVLTFRMSALDLIEGGMDDDEILALARALEAAGADCLSSGIGWHESQVPTISGTVPPAAFTGATQAIRAAVSLPVVASNRINLPETAEAVLAAGQADLISMARPFLADADFVNKAVAGASDRITVCVACNKACLHHYFTDKIVTCLVNPKAAREAEFAGGPAPVTKRVAVVGAGVAGIACALAAAGRGHAVTLFDRADAIGGQFRLAARIPGKADFGRAIAGFAAQLAAAGVTLRLGERVDASRLAAGGFDSVVVATGVDPRPLDIAGADHPKVIGYTEVLSGQVVAGAKVAVIGGGGIGHDTALFLAHGGGGEEGEVAGFRRQWGIGRDRVPAPPARAVTMLQRRADRFGRGLGKSTGWILRQELRDYGVRQIAGVTYRHVDDAGLHITVDGRGQVLDVDHV
ncbi:MAG: 2,4-dienoyl-CoA reductase FMN-binding domain-containing protein, partial [Pseudomonadota bacterium]|nr:2,4-dienoyl-CoA reductase FMN-binding domain-containing protein [Pseudomonadota bacterium]